MTAPVDVLAVMDAAANWMDDHPATSVTYSGDVHEARAAVAELLERERVMREALEDLRKQCRNNLEVGATGPGYWVDAQETIDAALARCKGGAA
jgi:hypothetical protein